MLEAMRKTHPKGRVPLLLDLDNLVASVKDIQQSYCKLRVLFTPDSSVQFWEQDSRLLSSLETSHWMFLLSTCLALARRVATAISLDKTSVFLQEAEGHDLTCVISSLAQIIVDGNYRTIAGFQSLVQKEWVAMGHPFLYRLGRISGHPEEESPVFLLFLDCVWQILQQFPAAFEFTETYLTTLWDSVHLSLFDTFLFNCEKDRRVAIRDHANMRLRSVWNWDVQFGREQLALFLNPLYSLANDEVLGCQDVDFSDQSVQLRSNNHRNKHPPGMGGNQIQRTSWAGNVCYRERSNNQRPTASHHRMGRVYRPSSFWSLRGIASSLPEIGVVMMPFMQQCPRYLILPVQSDLPLLRLWALCYLRWLPHVQVVGGGTPSIYLQQCNLVKEIHSLHRQMATLLQCATMDADVRGDNPNATSSSKQTLSSLPSYLPNSPSVSLSHAESSKEILTSSYPFSPGGSRSMQGVPQTFFFSSNYIASDDEWDDL